MKTMKKFWKYFLNFLVLIVLVIALTYWGTSKMKKNENTIEKEVVNNVKTGINTFEDSSKEFINNL